MPATVSLDLASSAPKGASIGSGVVIGKNGVEVPTSLGLSAANLAARGFEGKPGQVVAIPNKAGTQILVGLGPVSLLTVDMFRTAAAALTRAAFTETHLATSLIDSAPTKLDKRAVAQAVAEGILLASYTYTTHRSVVPPRPLSGVTLIGRNGRLVEAGLAKGKLVAEAVLLNRDLVNEPPASMTPRILAGFAERAAADNGLAITIFDESDLDRERLGGLKAVSLGSAEPPRMVKMVYTPKGAARNVPTITLVGKGVTFDSGGLSLKPSDGMLTMKCDMAGAGLVISIMSIIARLAPASRVIGYCCCTENMPSGTATKLGDVMVARNGKTVENHNTDAEGRLVLMDGLSLAVEDKPDAIVDIATLTGAAIVALGTEITAVLGNNASFTSQVMAAAKSVGEETWELPLFPRYRKHIDSSVADMKNIGNAGQAGSIIGGIFLQEFVDGRPWVHLDVAGPAFVNADDGYITRGGTGVMVRTLIELIETFERPKK
jgi:leucyl aminopeptidase